MRRFLVLAIAIVCVGLVAPDALATNRAVFTDKGGDACCTEDIRRVVVSNDDAGRITFAITAPFIESAGSASDRFVEIDTETSKFLIGTNPDGEGYVLWRGALQVLLGPIRASHRGGVFRFVVDRHRLGDTDRFRFGVAFWSVTSLGGANLDAAPDAGKWPYQVRLALGRVRPALGVRQDGSRLSAGLGLQVGDELLASGTIICVASVGARRLRLLTRGFVARRAVCVWEVPRWARGKVVQGAIGVRVTSDRSSLRRRTFRRLLA